MPTTAWLSLTTFSNDSSNSGNFAWTSPGNAASNDASGATAATSTPVTPPDTVHTQYLKGLQVSGLDTSDWTGITAVSVRIRNKADDNGADEIGFHEVQLVFGGTVQAENAASGDTGSTTEFETTYSDKDYAFSTLPSVAQAGASNFGVVVSVRNNAASLASTVDIDSILIQFTYTSPCDGEILYKDDDSPSNTVRCPTNVGDCEYVFTSTDCGWRGLEIAVDRSTDGYCWGNVNEPRWHYVDYYCSNDAGSCPSSEVILTPTATENGRAGFSLEGVIQFFNRTTNVIDSRAHSALTFHWDPIGKLNWLELTNYTGEITLTPLWIKDSPENFPLSSDEFYDSSDCPISPMTGVINGLPSSDLEDGSSGCFIRCFSLLGDIFSGSSDFAPSSDQPDSGCNGSVKNFYGTAELSNCNGETISTEDPTLTGHAREMVLEIDSAGLLKKVYFGDSASCESIDCVWDRDNPPVDADGNDTAGVVVPVLKLFTGNCGQVSLGDDLELWLIHFASTGHYIKACLYTSLCGCTITTDRPDGESPPCICYEYACIETGNCLRPENPGYCPDTATFTCAEASINPSNCSPIDNLFCVYSFNNQCCSVTTPVSSYIVPTDPSSSEGESCEMRGDAASACTS